MCPVNRITWDVFCSCEEVRKQWIKQRSDALLKNFVRKNNLHKNNLQSSLTYQEELFQDGKPELISCTAAWIVLMAALIIQNVEAYLCGTIGSMLAILYYLVLNNRMLAYVEEHIYGGKWNEYKSDSDNK